MKSKTIITMGVMGMLMFIPTFVSAEESATGADGSIAPPPAAPATADSWSFGESNSGSMHQGGGMGAGKEMPPKPDITSPRDPASGLPTGKRQHQPVVITKEMDKATPKLMEGVVKSPRDSASGQATGKRMMASGTRPLDEKMGDRMEKRDHMMGSSTGVKGERMEERKEALKERMEEKRGEIIKRMSTQMITRMEAAIARFTKLADRLDSRALKLKENGADTTTAVANIAIARAKISEATAAVALAKSSIESAVASAGAATEGAAPSDAGKTVRESLQKAREAVEAARKALVVAVGSLKGGSRVGGSTTTDTSVTP